MQSILQKLIITFLAFCLSFPCANARRHSQPDLAASLIPDSLKNEYAHAVVRFDSTNVQVKSKTDVQVTNVYAITVLNENGSDYGNLYLPYSNLTNITSITGTYYDAQGNPLKQIHTKDVTDISTAIRDFAFNSDGRVKIYHYISVSYPYTVVYELKYTKKNTLFLPGWYPQEAADLSIGNSVFVLHYPDSINIKSKAYNRTPNIEETTTKENGSTIKTWRSGKLPAFEYQPMSRVGNFSTPALVLVATDFDLMGHQGKLDNWKDFGKFFYDLNKGRDSLSPEMTTKAKALIKKDTSVFQKVQTLYRYMQKNTRYVLDAYGLAAWQTFPATEVCEKGYGDCKGLTNYLKALLKAVGVPSYMTLASAGSDDFSKVDPSFPKNYFNHVILCVPNHKDSIWVECTSPVFQAGYLGDFTDDRYVLVCGPEGGQLIKTPSYGLDKTFIERKAVVPFQPSQQSQMLTLSNYYSGPAQDELYMFLKTSAQDEIQKAVSTKFDFPSYKVKDFHYNFSGTPLLPAIRENVEASVTGIVNKTGNRYFVRMDWSSNPMTKIIQASTRTQPLVFDRSFAISDSVILHIPKGYKIEFMPENVAVDYPFASFQCSYHQNGATIVFFRKYQQRKGIYQATEFSGYQSLYHKLNQQKNASNIVLIHQESADAVTQNNQ